MTSEITYWTTKYFNEQVQSHYKDMKVHGWTKSQAKKDIKDIMKDNNIQIKN